MQVLGIFCITTLMLASVSAQEYQGWADAGLQAYLLDFWSQQDNYIASQFPGPASATGYWTFAQGYDAVIDGFERTNGAQYAGTVETFYNVQNAIGWSRNWYDDENWMAMANMRAYRLTGNQQYLNVASNLFSDISNAWDTTCCGPLLGGVWWDKSHSQKATAANAGPIILAIDLYLETGDSSYLQWATQVYNFWANNMVNSQGQVADHFDTSGNIVWWKFTYNNGLMVGAALRMYQATGNSQYLSFAHKCADFMVTQMTTKTHYGQVLTDGDNGGCTGDCSQFKGPSFRYLMELYKADSANGAAYLDVLQASVHSIWNIARNGALFGTDWSTSPSGPNVDSAQNSACQALSVFAYETTKYPGPPFPSNQYEAENGILNGVGLEGNNAGFSGWGYVAGFGSSGQSVDIRFNSSSPSYVAVMRYASTVDATRSVSINGQFINNYKFPSTGSYSTYKTIQTDSLSSEGATMLSISTNSGTYGFINLDNVVINYQ